MKIEDFFTKLKGKYRGDEKIEQTKGTIKLFHIKNGEKLTQLILKKDVILLAAGFEQFI